MRNSDKVFLIMIVGMLVLGALTLFSTNQNTSTQTATVTMTYTTTATSYYTVYTSNYWISFSLGLVGLLIFAVIGRYYLRKMRESDE